MASVSIDGDLSDWPVSLPYYGLEAFQLNPPEDATDFHGRFRIGYNTTANALYISVEVDDDVTVLDPPRNDGSGFLLRPSHPFGRTEHYGVWGDNDQPIRAFRATQVEEQFVDFAVQRANGHHIYEWRLDVEGIGVTRIETGTLWSLTIGVLDVDGSGRRAFSPMTWGKPAQVSGFAPGDVLLVSDIGAMGTIEGQVAWTDKRDEIPPRQVWIESEVDSSFHIRLDTDSHGRYAASLPHGLYRLAVGDARMERGLPLQAQVTAGTTVSLDVLQVVRTRPSDFYAAPADLARVHRGVCWVAAGRDLNEYDMLPLVRNGVEWISQTTFGWQAKYNSPEIQLNRHSSGGESDAGIAEASRLARKFGIRTMLKPHIWLTRSDSGKWRSDIAMDSEEEWQQWFDQYRSFILRYARLAEEHGIEALCIGTELHRAAVERERDWRRLIAEIRSIYNGKLIYAANWYKEFEEVTFWDDLDYIGVQAYFPLVEEGSLSEAHRVPSVEALEQGWVEHLEAIERVHDKFQKPVIITEIGYRSTIDAAVQPWKWETGDRQVTSEERLQAQSNCYEAFFRSFWGKDLFAGVYFWKWFPPHYGDAGGPENRGFTPQNKPAELTMRRWYGM